MTESALHLQTHNALHAAAERLCIFVDTSVEMGGLEFCRQRPPVPASAPRCGSLVKMGSFFMVP